MLQILLYYSGPGHSWNLGPFVAHLWNGAQKPSLNFAEVVLEGIMTNTITDCNILQSVYLLYYTVTSFQPCLPHFLLFAFGYGAMMWR